MRATSRDATGNIAKRARRTIGGAIAKANGKYFEAAIVHGARKCGVEIIRIADGAKRVGGNRLIPVAQPFDFAGVLPSGKAIFFDAKTLNEKVASFNANDHSIAQRMELHRMERGGAVAGFVVQACKTDEVLFVPASQANGRLRWDDPRWVRIGKHGMIDFTKLDTPNAA